MPLEEEPSQGTEGSPGTSRTVDPSDRETRKTPSPAGERKRKEAKDGGPAAVWTVNFPFSKLVQS